MGDVCDPVRVNDVREFCRCGITNFGAGCGVHCGGNELADVCLANAGRFIVLELVTWIDVDRTGAGTLFLGGIAGGGPRAEELVTEFCDWTRGGNCGSLPFNWSVDDWREITLGVFCKIAEVTLDMDCEIELWAVLVCGWTVAIVTAGFCGCIFTTVWALFGWGDGFGLTLLLLTGWCFDWFVFTARKMNGNHMNNYRKPIECEINRYNYQSNVIRVNLPDCVFIDGDIGDFCCSIILWTLKCFFCSCPAATYENTHSTE